MAPRKVLPVLPGDVLAKFLHGSANYFLSSSAEKRLTVVS